MISRNIDGISNSIVGISMEYITHPLYYAHARADAYNLKSEYRRTENENMPNSKYRAPVKTPKKKRKSKRRKKSVGRRGQRRDSSGSIRDMFFRFMRLK